MGVFENIYRKTPVLKSLFNIVADLKSRNFVKKRLQHRCFPVNIAIFLKTAFLQKTSAGCFLNGNIYTKWVKIYGFAGVQSCRKGPLQILRTLDNS